VIPFVKQSRVMQIVSYWKSLDWLWGSWSVTLVSTAVW